MILSDVSVRRPVFATVLALLLLAFGVLSFDQLPLREYPDIDPPVVSVSTTYPGASSSVVETRVTEILEDQIAGIEAIRSMESSSVDGRSSITVEFNLDRDIDAAANDVRDRVSRVLGRLPEDSDPPQVTKSDTDASPIAWITLNSSQMSLMELTDYADRFIVDRLSVIDGVARIQTGSGGQRPAMRIWLNPRAMAARDITVDDVEGALRTENVELPAGSLESDTRTFTVRMARLYRTPEDFAKLPVATGAEGHIIRLGEVAEVKRGPEEERSYFRGNGQPTVGLGVVRQSQADTIAVTDEVRAEIDRIRESLPQHMSMVLGFDDAVFIRAAIQEVYITLAIAMGLVVGVIYLFLGSVRAMLIPAVVVPVCLVATFSVLYAFGFSVNLLTLLALVLAIGLVVDDSIVMLENIHRRIEEGEPPLLAAFHGARQVAFAIIAMTLVLVAVFAPIAFMQGNTGRLFTELAAAISAAVIFSAFLALSLSPMMCSKLLRPAERNTRLSRWIDAAFDKVSRSYRATLGLLFGYSGWVVLGVVGVFVAIAVLLRVVPSEFAPEEDRGMFMVMMTGPEGASFDYSVEHIQAIEKGMMTLADEGLADRILTRVPSWMGGSGYNTGIAVADLVPWGEREPSAQELMGRMQQRFSDIAGVQAFPVMQQGLVQRGGNQPVQFVIGGRSYEQLGQWRETMLNAIAENPAIFNVQTDLEETKPQFEVAIDRDRAADLDVSVQAVGRTLETLMGGREMTTYIEDGEEYPVIVRAGEAERQTPDDLRTVYVRSGQGNDLVPLSNLVRLTEQGDINERNHFNRQRALTISASLAEGYRLGEALTFLENAVRANLPAEAQVDYKGASREFVESSTSLYFSFALALVIVFLVLAAQFESFIHPFVIMMTVPLGVAGALLGLFLTDSTLNIYSQIGIIILIGIAAKNGILIVEFTNQMRDAGRSFEESLLNAAQVRLRPIIMTSMATAMGAVPLIIGTGAGAQSRFTIGVVIFSGVIVATAFTLFVVPVFYHMLGRYTGSPSAVARRLRALEEGRGQPEAGQN